MAPPPKRSPQAVGQDQRSATRATTRCAWALVSRAQLNAVRGSCPAAGSRPRRCTTALALSYAGGCRCGDRPLRRPHAAGHAQRRRQRRRRSHPRHRGVRSGGTLVPYRDAAHAQQLTSHRARWWPRCMAVIPRHFTAAAAIELRACTAARHADQKPGRRRAAHRPRQRDAAIAARGLVRWRR